MLVCSFFLYFPYCCSKATADWRLGAQSCGKRKTHSIVFCKYSFHPIVEHTNSQLLFVFFCGMCLGILALNGSCIQVIIYFICTKFCFFSLNQIFEEPWPQAEANYFICVSAPWVFALVPAFTYLSLTQTLPQRFVVFIARAEKKMLT